MTDKTDKSPVQKLAYSMKEARQALGFGSQATLYEQINSGRLRTYKVGGRRYCTHDALIEFQHDREVESAA
jgi:hypothetical protein